LVCDDPRLDANRPTATDRTDFTFFERSQQLHLHRGGGLADFIAAAAESVLS
jgi:hypothetical protein